MAQLEGAMGNLTLSGADSVVIYGEGSPFVYVSHQNLMYYGNRFILPAPVNQSTFNLTALDAFSAMR